MIIISEKYIDVKSFNELIQFFQNEKIKKTLDTDENVCYNANRPELQNHYADVAQLVEQLIRNQQVRGSSPLISSISGRIAQLVRAPASHAGGRRFESVCVHQNR